MQIVRTVKRYGKHASKAFRAGMAHGRATRKGNVTPRELIGGFVAILVGLGLLPAVQDFVAQVNATGITATLVDLIPLFYVLGVVVGTIGFLGLRRV